MFIILADTVAIFAMLNWELGIVEAIIVIMSVGLSVDFVVHFGVGYIHTDSHDIDYERKRIHNHYVSSELDTNENPNHPSIENSFFLIEKFCVFL